jgi:hypothetical protein
MQDTRFKIQDAVTREEEAVFAHKEAIMSGLGAKHRIITIIRWVARIWSIPIFLFVLGNIVASDPNVVRPIPITDWIELSFYWIATLGLLLAWRWEGVGGTIAIAGILGHGLAFRVIRGTWFIQTLPLVALGVPGILFLGCWVLSRGGRGREKAQPTIGVGP